MASTRTDHDFGVGHPATEVAASMTVGEARTVLAASGQPALPVAGHGGLLGLITVEALGGHVPGGTDHPADDLPVLAVMDWHLVQVAPETDEQGVLAAYTDAAWRWLTTRHHEAAVDARSGAHLPATPWWMGAR